MEGPSLKACKQVSEEITHLVRACGKAFLVDVQYHVCPKQTRPQEPNKRDTLNGRHTVVRQHVVPGTVPPRSRWKRNHHWGLEVRQQVVGNLPKTDQ